MHPLDPLLQEAHERFKTSSDAWSQQRREALDDLKFSDGEQWLDNIVRDRDKEERPCLTINRIPQFVKQITNDQRQNDYSVVVSPVDDDSDPEVAEVLEGIIRHIETKSDADVAYDTGFEYAAKVGMGYWRVLTDYVDANSFEQEIKVERINDPFAVYPDPAARKADYSDMRYCFIVQDMPIEEYKAEYPDSEMASLESFSGVGHDKRDWCSEEEIRVAEYFYIKKRKETLYAMGDGRIGFWDELFPGEEMPSEEEFAAMPPETQQKYAVVQERQTEIPSIHWCKFNAVEKLEQAEWPGKYIPVVPVLGDEIFIEGKRRLRGIVRGAKDAQRMYNYWASAETEQIALAPKAPYVGAAGQFEGHEKKWREANRRNFAYLEYNQVDLSGQPAPPPQRNAIEPAIQAITMARMNAAEDLKAVTGIYDASLGSRSNETSGRAIIARQREGDVSTFNFQDNLSRALRHTGRIFVDLIPHIYDTNRIARIIGADQQEKKVQVTNDPQGAAKQEIPQEDGSIEKIFNVGVGRYDVTVSSGPSYSTKRQEAAESMAQITQVYPNLMAVAGDLLVKNMDWPGAKELAERLKKTLPPHLQEDEEGVEIPPQVQAQMQQMAQQIEQMTAQLQEMTRERETEALKLQHEERIEQMKIQSKERLEAMKARVDLMRTEEELRSKENIEMLKAEISSLGDRLEEMAIGEPV